eukprot:1141661-Pelagomonas_calceolata.AAC.7
MAGASSISREDISSAFAMQANTEGEKVLSISDLLASCPEDGVWVSAAAFCMLRGLRKQRESFQRSPEAIA